MWPGLTVQVDEQDTFTINEVKVRCRNNEGFLRHLTFDVALSQHTAHPLTFVHGRFVITWI